MVNKIYACARVQQRQRRLNHSKAEQGRKVCVGYPTTLLVIPLHTDTQLYTAALVKPTNLRCLLYTPSATSIKRSHLQQLLPDNQYPPWRSNQERLTFSTTLCRHQIDCFFQCAIKLVCLRFVKVWNT